LAQSFTFLYYDDTTRQNASEIAEANSSFEPHDFMLQRMTSDTLPVIDS